MASHSNVQGYDPRKRKADALSPNSGTAEKRPYQNGNDSAWQPSQDPLPASLKGGTAQIYSPSRNGPDDRPNLVNPPASTFPVANQPQESVSLACDNRSIRRVHAASNAAGSAASLSEIMAAPVASSGPSTHRQSYRSLPSATSRERECEGETDTHTSCNTPSTTITHPAAAIPAAAAGLRNNVPAHSTAGLREATISQCKLLSLLLGYMFPTDGCKVEEVDLSQNLEEVWAQHEQDFERALNDSFASHHEALLTWIDELRTMREVQLELERDHGAHLPALALRMYILNDVRTLRLRWRTIKARDGDQDLSLEDLLCRILVLMTKTKGIEQLFKEGLKKRRDTALQGMISEDLTISMYPY